ncbi:alpha/beta hydrolase [Actinomyces trachealis]|uniref:alpha/beta hydrolase n=1 Tax=Actinomyces trachealis TaxID=2763540 RepID=UPI001892A727|nr:alpha/beta hydrolase [Actinomyces trachealis]
MPEPAPVTGWGPDLLGPGFQARTIELLPDDEDDGAVATLVRHLPVEDPGALRGTPSTPTFVCLYLHGWNDYFFQCSLAREFAALGGAFYALDLRRYGRSLREGQMLGWVTNLNDYDEEIGQALAIIRAERDEPLPLVLMGHSTGGLTAALWADRHPGALTGLILESPWLEMQGSNLLLSVGEPIINTLARLDPRMVIPTPTAPPEQLFTASDGWDEQRDGPIPDPSWEGDPYVTGYPINPEWCPRPSAPIRPGWLQTILAGHARVNAGLDIRCPVLAMSSARSHLGITYNMDSRSTDTVLDATAIAHRAVDLGALVTVARFDGGVHNLILSAPPVREQVYSTMRRWIGAYVLR